MEAALPAEAAGDAVAMAAAVQEGLPSADREEVVHHVAAADAAEAEDGTHQEAVQNQHREAADRVAADPGTVPAVASAAHRPSWTPLEPAAAAAASTDAPMVPDGLQGRCCFLHLPSWDHPPRVWAVAVPICQRFRSTSRPHHRYSPPLSFQAADHTEAEVLATAAAGHTVLLEDHLVWEDPEDHREVHGEEPCGSAAASSAGEDHCYHLEAVPKAEAAAAAADLLSGAGPIHHHLAAAGPEVGPDPGAWAAAVGIPTAAAAAASPDPDPDRDDDRAAQHWADDRTAGGPDPCRPPLALAAPFPPPLAPTGNPSL